MKSDNPFWNIDNQKAIMLGGKANGEVVGNICGVPVRLSAVIPDQVVGVANEKFVTYFWQGVEVGKFEPVTTVFTKSQNLDSK